MMQGNSRVLQKAHGSSPFFASAIIFLYGGDAVYQKKMKGRENLRRTSDLCKIKADFTKQKNSVTEIAKNRIETVYPLGGNIFSYVENHVENVNNSL